MELGTNVIWSLEQGNTNIPGNSTSELGFRFGEAQETSDLLQGRVGRLSFVCTSKYPVSSDGSRFQNSSKDFKKADPKSR